MTHSFPSRRASDLVGLIHWDVVGGDPSILDGFQLLLRPHVINRSLDDESAGIADDGEFAVLLDRQHCRRRKHHYLVCVLVRRARCYRSEEHPSELQSLMRISYAVFCLKKQK